MFRRPLHSFVEQLEKRTIFSISFLPAVQSAIGSLGPMTSGDFTGDGIPDVVALDTALQQVHLYPGAGNGHFLLTGTFVPLDAGDNVVQMVTGDVNRDGMLDVVAVNGRNGTNTGGVTVVPGTNSLFFAPGQHYAAGPSPTAVAIGDFNRDGRPDLAVANDALWPAITPTGPQGFGAGILYGTNAGFTPVARLPLMGPTVSVAAQPPMPSLTATNALAAPAVAFAGPNLLVASPLPITSLYLFPTGLSIAAVPPITIGLTGENRGLAIADLSRDGRADVVALQALGANATNAGAITVHAIVSRPASTATAPYGYAPLGPFATGLSDSARPGLAIADFDVDGRIDVAVAGIRPLGPMLPAFQGGVAVLQGRGGGYFAAPQFFATGAQPRAISIADANRDRRPDVLTGSVAGVSALLNRSAASTNAREPIDLDPDVPGLLPSILE